MAGIFHAYYTVALAPAVAAVVGIGAGLLWQRRGRAWARLLLAATVAGTALWAWVLLGRSAEFLPWLRWVVLVAGVLAAAGLFVVDRVGRAVVAGVLAVAVVAGLAGPAAYAVQTASTPHTGSIPSAGPTVAGAGFGPGGGRPGGFGGGPGAGAFQPPPGGATGQPPAGGLPGGTGTSPGGTGTRGTGGFGGMGGLLDAAEPSEEVVARLSEDASSYTWAAATVGANSAAGYQLATALPVMPVGGFNGSDPSPTLAEFQSYVRSGQVHWSIGGGIGMRSAGGSDAASEIATWVAENYTTTTVDGVTLYDLTQPTG
jgi:hypothetical protein